MAAKRLTPEERAWLAKLQQVLAECPSIRLGAYTIGDASLNLYDTRVAKAWEQANPVLSSECDAARAHRLAGADLGTISMPFQIDSCAG